MATKKKVNEAELKRVEVALVLASDHYSHQYLVYDEITNRELYRSEAFDNVYTTRSSAKVGAERYAKRNNMKITQWMK